jgi:succinate-semialdehyde dehydrogenase/glutarate-semialdehyde dehydrogenase
VEVVMALRVVDPSTGKVIDIVAEHTSEQVEQRLATSYRAWQSWRRTSFSHRAQIVGRIADLLEERCDAYAVTMVRQMGKPIVEAMAEVRKCAWVCRYYAENAEKMLSTELAVSDAGRSEIRHDPLGVVLAIMPWNFPLWQALRFGAPALMAGNALLIKHAPSTPGVARDLEQLLVDAGVPPGLVPALYVDNQATGELIADPRVAAVTLTGSTRAGSAVATQCGRHLKPCVLELGGSDPFIVLDDADVAAAAHAGAFSRLLNCGQSCIAAKRFIVVESVADLFIGALGEALAAAVQGDPMDPDTTLGPMARDDLRRELDSQVRRSVEGGAVCVQGGQVPFGEGYFYPATLLTGVLPGMPAWDDELFGPVAAVRVVADADAALKAANDSIYGLSSSVWTEDDRVAKRFIEEIDAGAVFINGMSKSDPRLPFGGIKRSGWGRELGRDGILEFVNRKTVWVR